MTTALTRSEKIGNLKDLQSIADYIIDMNTALLTRTPNALGQVLHLGEPITWTRYSEAVIDFNVCAKLRNEQTGERIPLLKAADCYKLSDPKVRRTRQYNGKPIILGEYNQLEFACSIVLFPDLWKLVMGKKYWTAYMADLRYANTIN